MSHEDRGSSNVTVPGSAASTPIPRPPPLPAPRPLQRARNAAHRFFGYASRPASPQDDNDPDSTRLTRGVPARYATLGATQDATASHKTGLEINTIAINEKGTHALLGGKEIFKTVRVEDGVCAEDLNLRTAIRSAPKQASGAPRQVYSIDIADVAWAKGDCGDYIAAATSSGKIILYDLGRAGLPAVQLHEHFRQVHKVTFNPHRGNLLLSGSQDGTVRLWDLRDIRHQASQLQSKRKYSGQSDGVRDVKWSPTDGVDFAFGTDSGWVQRWDIRNLKTAKVKIPAHTTTCNSVDWHADGKHLASAGNDKTVRVWDLSTGRRQKAGWEIKTPHPILNARWRPAYESSMLQDNGARLCTQIVTAYSHDNPTLHIWDFRRSSLPFREIAPHQFAPTDLIWHSQDLLWTVGREGKFQQTDTQHAQKVMGKRPLQVFAVSPHGDINFVTQRRRRRRRPSRHQSTSLPPKSYSVGHSPEQGSFSRSWQDDSLDQNFLRFADPKHRVRSAGSSRAPSISQTPPQREGGKVPIIKLDDVLSNRKSARPQQHASRGKLPDTGNDAAFAKLANRYETSPGIFESGQDTLRQVEEAFRRNAVYAEKAGFFRLAQTWRITGFATTTHLKARAEARREDRLQGRLRFQKRLLDVTNTATAINASERNEQSSLPSPGTMHPFRAGSILSKQLASTESNSDMTTPLARPFPHGNVNAHALRPSLEDPDKSEQLTLPPSLASEKPPMKDAINSKQQSRLTAHNLEGFQKPQWTDGTTSGAQAIRRWSVQPKVPLSLDPVDADGNKLPPKLEHRDSGESFSFLESSFESRGPSMPASFASNDSAPLQMPAERPSRALPRVEETEGTDFRQKIQAFEREAADETEVPNFRDPFKADQPDSFPEVDSTDVNRATGISEQAGKSLAPKGMSRLSEDLTSRGKRNSVSDTALMNLEQQARKTGVVDDLDESYTFNSGLDLANYFSGASAEPITKKGLGNPASQEMIPADFVANQDDPDVEEDRPFTLVSMLQELLAYYSTTRADSQTASHLLLLLAPLLPQTYPLPAAEVSRTTNHYSTALASTGFSRHEIPVLLSQTLNHNFRAGLQPLQLESILSTYHDQLLSRRLFIPAAALRKATYPSHPAVYEQALKDNFLAFKCNNCCKPVETPTRDCASCTTTPAPACAICWCEESPFPASEHDKKTIEVQDRALWSTCLLCNHTSHSSCLQIWFSDASTTPEPHSNDDGEDQIEIEPAGEACPTEGCLCACVAGSWREQKERERVLALKRPGLGPRGKVRSDDWGVRESRAVEKARVALVGGGGVGSV